MNKQKISNELNKLLQINSLEQYTETEALKIIQDLIEHSNKLRTTKGTQKAISLSKSINPIDKFPKNIFLFHYFIGIAWGDLKQVKHMSIESWDWEHTELENEMVHFRLAFNFFDEKKHKIGRFLQICTNLGNSLDYVGRFASAFEHWDICLGVYPKFGMAIASLGNSVRYHGYNTLTDEGHKKIYIEKGCQILKLALQYEIEPHARSNYEEIVKWYEANLPEIFSMDTDLYPPEYASEEEKVYRKWSFSNCLFLHPLNDIFLDNAEYDPLMLPTMIVYKEDAGSFHSFFNQIKQEYCSARYFYYEGLTALPDHFSDNQIAKYDMYDYSQNLMNTEKIKTAFRVAYSIFDKVSFFLNYYMKLNIPERSVGFKTLWFDKKGNLRPEFQHRQNLMFRGLYWLSKDLYYSKDEDFVISLSPDAQELANIRNHIEHKSFRIIPDRMLEDLKFIPEPLKDNLSFSIGEKHFYNKTKKVLKMAREAIMYLALGINYEERFREKPEGFIPDIDLAQK